MNRFVNRTAVLSLAVVSFVFLLTDPAFAARPCKLDWASTPAERAELWREALATFTAEHPNLTAAQAQVVAEAARLGQQIAAPPQDERAQAVFARSAARMIERAREVFKNDELGRFFTDMGQTQVWLFQMAASTPYCNCSGTGTCQFNGGPSGKCEAGCISWDSGGTRYDGLCSSAEQVE